MTKTKQMLKIIRARSGTWYAGLLGKLVPYGGKWREGYKSREPAGYINIVYFDDAMIVDEPALGASHMPKPRDPDAPKLDATASTYAIEYGEPNPNYSNIAGQE